VRLIGFIETVGTGVVSSDADTQRHWEEMNTRRSIIEVFFRNDHMREWWMEVSKKVLGEGTNESGVFCYSQ